MPERILAFGSNLLGIHGAGLAKLAKEKYGAQPGVGKGRTGMAYAIPTKKFPSRVKRQFQLSEIRAHVNDFLIDARADLGRPYLVPPIGCGLAGYYDYEIAPMFGEAPANCVFSPQWAKFGLPVWSEGP